MTNKTLLSGMKRHHESTKTANGQIGFLLLFLPFLSDRLVTWI